MSPCACVTRRGASTGGGSTSPALRAITFWPPQQTCRPHMNSCLHALMPSKWSLSMKEYYLTLSASRCAFFSFFSAILSGALLGFASLRLILTKALVLRRLSWCQQDLAIPSAASCCSRRRLATIRGRLFPLVENISWLAGRTPFLPRDLLRSVRHSHSPDCLL